MQKQLDYQQVDVKIAANSPVNTYDKEITLRPGFERITGIAVERTGDHTQFNVGLNDGDNNTEVGQLVDSFYSPNSKDGRMLDVDIPLNGRSAFIIKTGIREIDAANAVKYQLILRLEK